MSKIRKENPYKVKKKIHNIHDSDKQLILNGMSKPPKECYQKPSFNFTKMFDQIFFLALDVLFTCILYS